MVHGSFCKTQQRTSIYCNISDAYLSPNKQYPCPLQRARFPPFPCLPSSLSLFLQIPLTDLCVSSKREANLLLMDLYEPCDLQLDIDCDYLDPDIERLVLASSLPLTDDDVKKLRTHKKEPPRPRPKRELRLGFKSHELRERFAQVLDNVPGRVAEANQIFEFIANSQNGTSSPLCLHGNTGCGKTSLITKVLQFFELNSGTVSVAYLNCMSTRTVNLIYTFILERFYGGKPRREMKASEGLQQHLRAGMGNEERTKIVVLDEIDHVINEHNFLYNMLEWLTVGAKLILILISNVIDLTIKLDSKLQSRWKFERIIFQPYSHPQIEQIIYHKYRDIRNLCRRDTVSYIAKRIFNINSDIRTLDKTYSRILTQFAEGGRRLLDIDAVKGLIYEENKAPTMQGSYAVIIRVLHKAEKRTEVSRQIFQKLFLEGRGSPRTEDVLYMLSDLQDAGFISINGNKKVCDVSFHDYGIKIHENLHLYSDN